MKRDRRILLPIFLVVATLCIGTKVSAQKTEPHQVARPKISEYGIVIHCSRKVLQLWRQTEVVREYPIETGKGGLFKQRSGDHRTPVGNYEITWMASRRSDKGYRIVDLRSWCQNNRFSDASTGPALEKLWSDSYGGDEASIMSINYPSLKDEARGFTGDCIHIHSDKHLTEEGALKKSYGCIHMFPKDAEDLYELVEEGTPVKILP
ncbi:MAG: L,D-transpeptidase [Deltaproteobacteria bacterium]|nr:L,D-transpeptidase [Deltaproteobacteria bacterium]